jgi:hypothetical protein
MVDFWIASPNFHSMLLVFGEVIKPTFFIGLQNEVLGAN